MKRSELIAALGTRFPALVADEVERAAKTILETMTDALARGGRIEIRGFGTFALNYRHPRAGRNPASGESVAVPAKYAPHFRPGKELAERVNPAAD